MAINASKSRCLRSNDQTPDWYDARFQLVPLADSSWEVKGNIIPIVQHGKTSNISDKSLTIWVRLELTFCNLLALGLNRSKKPSSKTGLSTPVGNAKAVPPVH